VEGVSHSNLVNGTILSDVLQYNLLYIVSCLERGGLELRLLEFARRFPENYHIHICVTSDRLGLLKHFQAANARIIVVPIRRAYMEFGNIRKIHKYIAANGITVINSFDFKGLMIGCLLKMQARQGTNLIHNTVDLLHSYTSRQKTLLRFLLQKVDRSVCNSVQAKDVLISIGIPEALIKVIDNGVDTARFKSDPLKRLSMRLQYGITPEETVIGTVANFRREKNYPFLVKNFHSLSEKYPSLRLLCVGGGPELERTRELVETIGISEKVIFTGSVEDIPDFLQMMDVFVLCSLKESFPNCMIQAMSSGVPVVASNIGACSDIIKDGVNGFKFEVNDSAQFARNLEMLMHDKEQRLLMAANGNLTVNSSYSQSCMIDNYLTLFSNLILGVPATAITKRVP
jgi:glycosyltransferase involved in cell wall biosynthesis